MWLSVIHFTTFSLWNKEVKAIIYVFLLIGCCKFLISKNKVIGVKLSLLFYMYFLYSFMNSLLFFDSIEKFFYGIYQYIFYPLLLYTFLYVFSKIDPKKVALYFTAIGFITSLIGIYEYINQEYLFYSLDAVGNSVSLYFADNEAIYRSMAFSTSPLSLGPLLGIFALTNQHFFRITKNGKFLFLEIVNIIALIMTFSRGSWVSFIIALGLYELFRIVMETGLSSVFMRVIKVFTTILLVGFVYVNFFADSGFIQDADIANILLRLQNIFDWGDDAGNIGRLYVWAQSFNMITDNIGNFFLGIGLASTGGAGLGSFSVMVTESGVLKRFVEGGFIMMLLYYSIVALVMKRGIQILFGKTRKYKNIILYALSCIILILVDDCTLQITEDISVDVFFWFFMAIIIFFSTESQKLSMKN